MQARTVRHPCPRLQVLGRLPALRNLSLRGCPVAELPGYREALLALVPRLEILDNQRVVERPKSLSKKEEKTKEAAVAAAASAEERPREAKRKGAAAGGGEGGGGGGAER